MPSSKKMDLLRDFAAGVYLFEAQNPTPHRIRVYCILIHTGKGGGGVEPQRRGEGQSSQNWVENTNMTDCLSSL
jgi:hypothetical protein